MCGILGTTEINVSPEVINLGLKVITKRGPDNKGITKNNYVVFGHTRLSILDLDQRSNQPFEYTHKNQKVLLTYNGEIYNFKEIRSVLIGKGYSFQTNSDTEVVAASYIEWGYLCFDYFVGMWAIAINNNEQLIFARDRVGKKPFYYSISDDGIISFSSSIKAVSILSREKAISKEGLELYFALGFIPKKYTIYKNIYKLEPCKIHIYEIKGDVFLLKSSTDSTKKNLANKKNECFKSVFKSSVEGRIVSDVPVTTLMSGGVDSTIITVITSTLNKNLEAFFVDFNDKKLSERKWASYLSKRNNVNLTRVLMEDIELEEGFKDYYKAFEEPFADYGGIPSIAIFKKISKKYKVVLTGDGGDELFYGYSHYFKKVLIYKLFKFIKIFKSSKILPKNLKNIVLGNKKCFESNYLRNHGIVTEFASKIINYEFNSSIKNQGSFTRGIIDYDRRFYNWPEKYLVKVDRASMFSSVEVRSPFMDESLLKKVSSISTLFLFTPFSSKIYLKLKYFRYFGFRYFFAKKKGFTPPIEYLRETYFKETDYNRMKSILSRLSNDLYMEMLELGYEDIKKDKILFDRFFFFNEWLKMHNKEKQ